MHSYIIAATGDWNREIFRPVLKESTGTWSYVTTPEELNDVLLTHSPKYIFFPHWRWHVPQIIVSQYNCICFHMTDVPFGRGGSPLQNLILRGHKDSVVTALQMIDETDAGPVYLKLPFPLTGSAEEIYKRASKIVVTMIDMILDNEITPVDQCGEVELFTRRTPAQSRVSDCLSVEKFYDFIRMLDAPGYPKAFLNVGRIRIEFDKAINYQDKVTARVNVTLQDGNVE